MYQGEPLSDILSKIEKSFYRGYSLSKGRLSPVFDYRKLHEMRLACKRYRSTTPVKENIRADDSYPPINLFLLGRYDKMKDK